MGITWETTRSSRVYEMTFAKLLAGGFAEGSYHVMRCFITLVKTGQVCCESSRISLTQLGNVAGLVKVLQSSKEIVILLVVEC